MRKIFTFLAAVSCACVLFATEPQVGDTIKAESEGNTLVYTVTGLEPNTVQLEATGHTLLKSRMVIPSSVTYLEQEFAVTAIADNANTNFPRVDTLCLPASLEQKINMWKFSVPSLKAFEVEEGSKLYAAVNGVLYSPDKEYLYRCPQKNPFDGTFAKGVIYIEEMAFQYCTEIATEISIPNTVDRLSVRAFQMSAITKIDIPASVTSLGDNTFGNCEALEEIHFEDAASVSVAWNTFVGAKILTDQTAEGIRQIDGLAIGWNAPTVDGKRAWPDTLVIPEGIVNIAYGFYSNCGYEITDFSTCKQIVLPSSLRRFDPNAFAYRETQVFSSLEKVIIKAAEVPNMPYGTWNLPQTEGQEVRLIVPCGAGELYRENTRLTKPFASVEEGAVWTITLEQSEGGEIAAKETETCGEFILIATPEEGYEFVKWNDDEAAQAERTINVSEDVTFSAVFQKIAAVGDEFKVAVDGDTLNFIVKKLDPDWTAYVTQKGHTVTNHKVVIPATVEYLGQEFTVAGLTAGLILPDVVDTLCIPASVVSLYGRINASNLKAFVVDEASESFTAVKGVLYTKDKKGLVSCPRRNPFDDTFPEEITSINSSAFSSCQTLTDVHIPNTVTILWNSSFESSTLRSMYIPASVTSISNFAFGNTYQLQSMEFEDVSNLSVAYDAFQNSSIVTRQGQGLHHIGPLAIVWHGDYPEVLEIPEGIENIPYGFYYDYNNGNKTFSKVKKIILPSTLRRLNYKAFAENATQVFSGLEEVIVKATEIPYLTGTLNLPLEEGQEVPLIVPCATGELYKGNRNWASSFALVEEQSVWTITLEQTEGGEIKAEETENCGEFILTATPEEGYTFIQWSDDDTEPAERTINVSEDVTFSAIFKKSQAEEVTTESVAVNPHPTSVDVIWPVSPEAVTYTIEIRKEGDLVCTLTFDAQGRLLSIIFAAPARNGQARRTREALLSEAGWQYTVTDLEEGQQYTYHVVAQRGDESVIYDESIDFETPKSPQAIDNTNAEANVIKHLINGQVFIQRGEKIYTVTGQEVK